ncbi:hypothetical protein D3C78_1834010 [compost metagenome]
MTALQGTKKVSRNRMNDLNAARNECWPSRAIRVEAPTMASTKNRRWRRLTSICPRKPLMMVAMHMKLP